MWCLFSIFLALKYFIYLGNDFFLFDFRVVGIFLYDCDLVGQGYSLTYGLYDEAGELIGISLGYIKHWYSGTEYIINELCIKTEKQGSGAGTFFIREIEKAIKELGLKQIFLLTDSNVPAYEFYKKNGFVQCETNVAFAKTIY